MRTILSSRVARAFGSIGFAAALIGGGVAVASQPAFASNNGVEICAEDLNYHASSPCADAYGNGGALIKSYAPGNSWEYIQAQSIGNGEWQMYDFNTGGCLGDYGNNQNDARVGDNLRCPSQGNAGWGTIFHEYSTNCNGYGTQLADVHWSGSMGGGAANGTQWYLNIPGSPTTTCYGTFG